MLIYDALAKDHVKINELLDRLVQSADADAETRKSLITQIRDELIPHARAEEAVFYNTLREIDESKKLAMHGYTEHAAAETMLRTLQGMDAVDANWRQLAVKLRDAIQHHVQEEEGEMFTTARQLLAQEEAEAIGEAFERMKPEVREEGFMQNTLDMIANMLPMRLQGPLRSFLTKH